MSNVYILPSRQNCKRFAMVPIDSGALRCHSLGRAARVYLAILGHMSREGAAFPKRALIASLTGISKRNVSHVIAVLVQDGLIKKITQDTPGHNTLSYR